MAIRRANEDLKTTLKWIGYGTVAGFFIGVLLAALLRFSVTEKAFWITALVCLCVGFVGSVALRITTKILSKKFIYSVYALADYRAFKEEDSKFIAPKEEIESKIRVLESEKAEYTAELNFYLEEERKEKIASKRAKKYNNSIVIAFNETKSWPLYTLYVDGEKIKENVKSSMKVDAYSGDHIIKVVLVGKAEGENAPVPTKTLDEYKVTVNQSYECLMIEAMTGTIRPMVDEEKEIYLN